MRRPALVLMIALAPWGAAAAQDFAALYAKAEDLRLHGDATAAAQQSAYAAAVAEFAKMPAHARERGALLPAAAFAALRSQDPARAAAWVAESVALGHDDALHAELLVEALARSGRVRAAITAMHDLSPRHPEAVERALARVQSELSGALCETADVALREGRSDEGLLVFQLLVKVSGRSPTALANLALALRHLGREEEAEARYREAIASAPGDPELWNDLGLLFKGQGRDVEATAAFVQSRALETRPPPSGPATSNLVAMVRGGRAKDVVADVPAALAGVLARYPQAAMAQYLLLRTLTDAPFPGERTDSRAPGR